MGVGGVLLCFPARLFEHAGEHVSDRLASVDLREREVGAGRAELFRVLETCDLLGCQLVGEVSLGCRVVVVRSHGLPLVSRSRPRGVYPIGHILGMTSDGHLKNRL